LSATKTTVKQAANNKHIKLIGEKCDWNQLYCFVLPFEYRQMCWLSKIDNNNKNNRHNNNNNNIVIIVVVIVIVVVEAVFALV
jgi:hypothetical protein